MISPTPNFGFGLGHQPDPTYKRTSLPKIRIRYQVQELWCFDFQLRFFEPLMVWWSGAQSTGLAVPLKRQSIQEKEGEADPVVSLRMAATSTRTSPRRSMAALRSLTTSSPSTPEHRKPWGQCKITFLPLWAGIICDFLLFNGGGD
jgi:hypothetical protein